MIRRDILRAGMATGVGLALAPHVAMAAAGTDSTANPREAIRLSDGWRFHLGHATDLERDFGFGRYQRTFAKVQEDAPPATMPAFDDHDWAPVRVPHDWAVELPFARPQGAVPDDRNIRDRIAAHGFKAIGREFPENSVGWYRLPLPIDAADRDRAVWLEFDGVFRNCIVFVNGCIVGESASGYAPFRVDLSNFLDYAGPNVLTVRVDASLGEGWFYEGAGIYRHVTLVKAASAHVPQWGNVVRATPQNGGAVVEVETDVANRRDVSARLTVRRTLVDAGGAAVLRLPEAVAEVPAHGEVTIAGQGRLAEARLWSVETPYLYRLVTELFDGGTLIDRTEARFGVRSVRFDADKGFFLNGRSMKLLGACNHQDHAGVGSAIPDRLDAWRIKQMQSMGCNAWRSAHNPPSQALLDLCDSMGMMMIVELRRNTTDDEALGELDRVVRRDRNHPCIILWSTGNEEPQQGMDRGKRITADLKRRINALDPTREINQAFYFEQKGYGTGAWDVVDVAGLNYRTDHADAFHAQFPKLPVILTETGSTVSTRGEYANDAKRQVVRAYDTEYPFWASTAEQWWPIAADRDYIGGGFIWTGFDYRGEPTPYPTWPSVVSQFGVVDLCGFPKDNYWYYRTWWRPDEPLVHLLPHWNWAGREGQPIEVWAYANCEEVELIVNGKSAGRQRMPRNLHLEWKVPYAPGWIEAQGYTGGRLVARARRETAGVPAALNIRPDRARIAADGDDLSMLTVEVVDDRGRVVPDAGDLIQIELAGAGRLIGVGNGDPNSHESDKASQRHAFNGMMQAIVQSSGAAGPITVRASSARLRPAVVGIAAGSLAGQPNRR